MPLIDRFYALPEDDHYIAMATLRPGRTDFSATIILDPEANDGKDFHVESGLKFSQTGHRLVREISYFDRWTERIKVEVDEDNKVSVLVHTPSGSRAIPLDDLAHLAAVNEGFRPAIPWKPNLDPLIEAERERFLAEARANFENFEHPVDHEHQKYQEATEAAFSRLEEPPDLEQVVKDRHLHSDEVPPEATAKEVTIMAELLDLSGHEEIFEAEPYIWTLPVVRLVILPTG